MNVLFYLLVLIISTVAGIDIITVKANIQIETLQIESLSIIYSILQPYSNILIPKFTSKIQYDNKLIKIINSNINSLEVSSIKKQNDSSDITITFHIENNKGLLIKKETNYISLSGFQNIVMNNENDFQYNFKIGVIQNFHNIKIDEQLSTSLNNLRYDDINNKIYFTLDNMSQIGQSKLIIRLDKKNNENLVDLHNSTNQLDLKVYNESKDKLTRERNNQKNKIIRIVISIFYLLLGLYVLFMINKKYM